jgi:hypothetical protein
LPPSPAYHLHSSLDGRKSDAKNLLAVAENLPSEIGIAYILRMSNTVVVRIPPLFSLPSVVPQCRKSDRVLTMNYNPQGAIYAQIIERIIEAAKNDFEEGGYDQSTLADLKEVSRNRTGGTAPCSNGLSCLLFHFVSHFKSSRKPFASKMAAMA